MCFAQPDEVSSDGSVAKSVSGKCSVPVVREKGC